MRRRVLLLAIAAPVLVGVPWAVDGFAKGAAPMLMFLAGAAVMASIRSTEDE